ncbi:serine threonine- kinase isoform A [Chlorella sorokiniana]|uniref:Serine threonine-kinase isoform A n=1 Tax=Chlorella sorokiniana TaxID=3076 RepID=A0A2P6TNE7_CHLSO|nr:serine threonine- kinase isoform A [Chlorella sorokiniana]|eukprot:PRW50855.1 serine threonine- kinase isoform A [Chlorella sorokiniana]
MLALCAKPARLAALSCRSRPFGQRRGPAAPRSSQGEPHKRSIEELAGQQLSGTDPGGELGALDPGPKQTGGGGQGGPRELEVDADLKAALLPLLRATRSRLLAHGTAAPSPRTLAEAAVAAAEASGALPPLAGAQRAAVEGFFARLAGDLPAASGRGGESEKEGGAFEDFGTSGGEAEFGEEDAALRIKSSHRELLEAVINAHLADAGSPHRMSGPEESVKAGGEVGNLALQSDTHGSEEPRGNPAESGSDRAERQAEAQFQQLELSGLPHASADDFARQRAWEAAPRRRRGGSAAVEGDAPAAGDGMQVVDSHTDARQLGGSGQPGTSQQGSQKDLVGLGLAGTAPQPGGWPLPPRLQEFYFAEMPNVTGPIPPGWRLPDTMTVLFSPGLPYGGSLSSEWILPVSLKFLNLERCNLSGPLPEGWPLPTNLSGVSLLRNSFTGTIPSSFTKLPNLQVLDLSDNQLTGSIPASMEFGQYELLGLNVANNNLSGRVPSWPDQPAAKAQLAIKPGNPDLCGQVPTAPLVSPVTELPPCPGDAQPSSGGSSTGAIVGGVVGGVVALTAVLLGAMWYVRRRRQRAQRTGSSALEDGLTDIKLVLPLQTGGTGSAALQPRPQPFNPFAAGPKCSQSGSSSASRLSSSNSRTLPISAAASLLAADAGSGGSSGPLEESAAVVAKLEALQRQPPTWFIDPDRIVLEQGPDGKLVLLGRGSYGHVYRGGLKAASSHGLSVEHTIAELGEGRQASSSNQAPKAPASRELQAKAPIMPAALKVMDTGDVNAFLKEVSVMQRLADCPQVVTLHGACVVGQQLVVAMELIQGGDLRAALSGERALELSWRRRGRQVALDIAAGLAHLHASNVMHRDLKSKNVLLTRDWRAKVADVGTAALHSATLLSAGSSMFGGTLAWAAPELLLAAPCTNKIDVYSLGVVLWELVTKELPRRGFVQPPPASEDCPQDLSELIGECLQQDPARRPTAQQVLERLQAL